jgi:acyl carrier protein
MIANLESVVDPVALHQELALREPIDICSSSFLRFVIRLSERMDFDIPREDYPQLATVRGCSEYVSRVRC